MTPIYNPALLNICCWFKKKNVPVFFHDLLINYTHMLLPYLYIIFVSSFYYQLNVWANKCKKMVKKNNVGFLNLVLWRTYNLFSLLSQDERNLKFFTLKNLVRFIASSGRSVMTNSWNLLELCITVATDSSEMSCHFCDFTNAIMTRPKNEFKKKKCRLTRARGFTFILYKNCIKS